MLQQDQPDDYVVATGEAHAVREFAELAFRVAGLNYEEHVEIDPQLFRPAEVEILLGDPSKARRVLGWSPTCTFAQLVTEMVESDLAFAESTNAGVPRLPACPGALGHGSSFDWRAQEARR